MAGKFPTSCGDFGSYKNEAALEYEAYWMLALGSKRMIGDQLHPNGTLDAETYRLIDNVYGEVKRKEPRCERVTPLYDLGALAPRRSRPPRAARTSARLWRGRRDRQQGPLGWLRLSTDIRYQNVRDEIDARWANHGSLNDTL